MSDRARHVEMIVREPAWLAHRYDPAHDAVHFLKVDRSARRQATFLIDKDLPPGQPSAVLHRAESVAAAPHAAPTHFIFHSGYCCSTLLAGALDLPGIATALKEPMILNDLVGWRRRGDVRERWPLAVSAAVQLLARPFEAAEVVIAKPSNVVNGIAASLLTACPSAKALLLHAPLPVYLGSIARKGLWGALWVREHLIGALADGIVDLNFTRDDLLAHTDLQVAAVGWLAQHQVFHALARQFGPARIRTTDSETLMANRKAAIAGLAAFFGLPLGPHGVAQVIEGPSFGRHSKTATPFSAADRAREQNELPSDRRDEIEKVVIWAEAVAKSAGLAQTLPLPLLG